MQLPVPEYDDTVLEDDTAVEQVPVHDDDDRTVVAVPVVAVLEYKMMKQVQARLQEYDDTVEEDDTAVEQLQVQ